MNVMSMRVALRVLLLALAHGVAPSVAGADQIEKENCAIADRGHRILITGSKLFSSSDPSWPSIHAPDERDRLMALYFKSRTAEAYIDLFDSNDKPTTDESHFQPWSSMVAAQHRSLDWMYDGLFDGQPCRIYVNRLIEAGEDGKPGWDHTEAFLERKLDSRWVVSGPKMDADTRRFGSFFSALSYEAVLALIKNGKADLPSAWSEVARKDFRDLKARVWTNDGVSAALVRSELKRLETSGSMNDWDFLLDLTAFGRRSRAIAAALTSSDRADNKALYSHLQGYGISRSREDDILAAVKMQQFMFAACEMRAYSGLTSVSAGHFLGELNQIYDFIVNLDAAPKPGDIKQSIIISPAPGN